MYFAISKGSLWQSEAHRAQGLTTEINWGAFIVLLAKPVNTFKSWQVLVCRGNISQLPKIVIVKAIKLTTF